MSTGFSFGSTQNTSTGFTFGSTKPATTTPSTGFSFGNTTGATTTPSTGFSFGSTSQPATTTPSTGFSFGSTSQPATTTPSTGFSFGTSTAATTQPTTTGFGGFGQTSTTTPATTSNFGFGSTSTSTSTGFGFGKPATTTAGGFGSSFGSGFGTPARSAEDIAKEKAHAELVRQAELQRLADTVHLVAIVNDDPFGLKLTHSIPTAEATLQKAAEQQKHLYGIVPTTPLQLSSLPTSQKQTSTTTFSTPIKSGNIHSNTTTPRTPATRMGSTFLSPGHGFPNSFVNNTNDNNPNSFASPSTNRSLLSSPSTVSSLHQQMLLARTVEKNQGL